MSICRPPGLALAAGLLAAAAPAAGQVPEFTLAVAVERALERHPGLRAANAQREAARAGVGEARAALWPQVRADASALRFEEPMVVAPLHGFNPQSPPLFDRTLIQVQVGLSQTLVDGGQRRALVRRAEARHAGGSAQATGAASAAIAEVVRAWLEVAAARAILRAEESRFEALETERERVRQFLEVGRAADVERLRIEAAVARAEADRTVREENLGVAEALLARLTDTSVAAIRAAHVTPLALRDTLPRTADLQARASRQSADLEQARARIAASQAAADATASAWWPELRLVAGYTDYSSGRDRLSGEWQAGLRAGYPLLLGGARRAGGRRAAEELRAAQADFDQASRLLADAIDRAAARARGAAARVLALASAVTQYEEVARIEALALEAGAGTQADWIAAQAELLGARAAWIEARQAEVAARVDIARLVGELSLATLMTLLEADR